MVGDFGEEGFGGPGSEFGTPGAEFGEPGAEFAGPGAEFGPPGAEFGVPSPGGPPPWMALPPELAKEKEKIVLDEVLSELALIREVTIGGVTRLSDGGLWRTYTGTPPSLCPT
jgi:hypothetical protein